MDIYWYGQSCFKLKGKSATVVIDPFDPEFTGLKASKDLEADFVLKSHDHKDHSAIETVKKLGQELVVFSGPGEYEVKGVVVTGIASFHDDVEGKERGLNTIFHLNIDGLNIVHLGDLGQNKLTEEQVQIIDQTDILLTPVGSVYTIDAKDASEIAAQLEPKIIIPMHYKIEKLKFELEEVDKFLKEMGAETVEPQNKLSITKDKLPEEPEVVVLRPAY